MEGKIWKSSVGGASKQNRFLSFINIRLWLTVILESARIARRKTQRQQEVVIQSITVNTIRKERTYLIEYKQEQNIYRRTMAKLPIKNHVLHGRLNIQTGERHTIFSTMPLEMEK